MTAIRSLSATAWLCMASCLPFAFLACEDMEGTENDTEDGSGEAGSPDGALNDRVEVVVPGAWSAVVSGARSAVDAERLEPSTSLGGTPKSGSNIPPVADAGPDQNVVEWVTVTLTGAASYDPDSGPGAMSYLWTQTGGTSVTITNPTTVSPTIFTPLLPSGPETLTFQLQVCDTDECDTDTVAINVASRATVTPDWSDGFESAMGSSWVTYASNSYGRTYRSTSYTPYAGSYHLIMDSSSTSTYALNEAVLFANLSNPTNVYLEFYEKAFTGYESSNTMSSTFTGHINQDGVAISVDGNTWYKVTDLTTSSSYSQHRVRLDTWATGLGITLTAHTLIKFQQYGYYYPSSGGRAFDNVQLYENEVPVANAGVDQTVDENALVTLNGTGSTDADGDPLTYLWTQIVGPTVTLSDNTSATPTFTSPYPIWEFKQMTFQLQVCDAHHCSTDVMVVSENDTIPNAKPVPNAGLDQNVLEVTQVTLTASAADPDGGPSSMTYAWSQTAGPTVTLSTTSGTTTSFWAPFLSGTIAALTFQV